MLKRFLAVGAVIVAVGAVVSAGLYVRISRPIFVEKKEVHLEKGMRLKGIAQLLAGEGVLEEPLLFMLYATLRGEASSLQAGDYRFEGTLSIPAIVERLVRGDVLLFSARIVEGWTYHDIAKYMASQNFVEGPHFEETFSKLCETQIAPTCEGYLFPDTYKVSSRVSADDFFHLQVHKFFEVYTAAVESKAKAIGWDMKSVVTLASLIEKETGAPEERAIISSVFHNRLQKGMLLQSDPTIIYGLKNFSGNIHKEDITNPHPYNTYVHAGLPPGPICSPGLASLLAAVEPAKTDYLYFVSKNDGTHYFSSTAAEHQKAVNQYQHKL